MKIHLETKRDQIINYFRTWSQVNTKEDETTNHLHLIQSYTVVTVFPRFSCYYLLPWT